MGVTFYLLWKKGLLKKDLGILYSALLVLNALWSPVFFGAHLMIWGALVIGAMLATLLFFIVRGWPEHKVMGYLNFPYVAWLLVAFSLNFSLIFLNSH